MAACVGVFLLQQVTGLLTTTTAPTGEVLPLSPLTLYGPVVALWGQWGRVLGTVVAHANIVHLALNMSVVWTLGTDLERGVGSARFLLLSLASAFGAAAFVLFHSFDTPTVGASGVILGWAGAMLPIVTAEMRRSLMGWLVQIALISFLPMVSGAGHLGGFVGGATAGLLLRWKPRAFFVTAPLLALAWAAAVVLAVRAGVAR
jgi:membrane associated rhomboid family serine protease